MPPETFDCELQHGVKPTMENPSKATLPGVADFRAQAMAHFKEHRDLRKTAEYSNGPYSGPIVKRRRQVGICTLSHPGDEQGNFLTAAHWTDAVIKAYVNADTLQQMIADLPAYEQAAAQEGGWVRDALALLDRPNGQFQALATMIRRDDQT
jgi:hypothetical protein